MKKIVFVFLFAAYFPAIVPMLPNIPDVDTQPPVEYLQENADMEATAYPTIKGELSIVDDYLLYQCGTREDVMCSLCDMKNSCDLLLTFDRSDPFVRVRAKSTDPKKAGPFFNYVPLLLPYSVVKDKKEDSIVKLFHTKHKCNLELVCKQLGNNANNTTFEDTLALLVEKFLKVPYCSPRCNYQLYRLGMLAMVGGKVAHGPNGFQRVPSLKKLCIKYIIFNEDKLSAEQIKLLPEELRQEIVA